MRTTVRLDDHLLASAKRRAADTGQTLTAVIENALRRDLAERRPEAAEPVALPTFKGNGTLPGVDLHDSAALLDIMEGRP